MDGKERFVRFFNHYSGNDCVSFEEFVEYLEQMEGNEGLYTLIEVVEEYVREE